MKLTAEQQAVVQHSQGHARIRAVAGSGKTTTLVARVLHLLGQGVPARRLLVVMYNRSAKEDFQAKLARQAALNGWAQPLPEVRTFHSLGYRLTQRFEQWGWLPRRQLRMEDWLLDRLIKQSLTEVARQQGQNPQAWLEEEAVSSFRDFCAQVKSGCETAQAVYEAADWPATTRHYVHAFDQLETLLADQQVMFFDDLIWRPVRYLLAHPDKAPALQGYIDQVIVDEYQDINAIQQQLLMILGQDAEMMVVGDVDQCIYEWRGARPDFMLDHFTQQYAAVQDYPLSTSFRFGHALAIAASQLIDQNRSRTPQLTLANQGSVSQLTQGQGVDWMLDQLEAWLAERPQASAAVLVRSWALSLPVQLALLKRHQAFQLPKNEFFVFNRPLIQALLGIARLISADVWAETLLRSHPCAQADFAQFLAVPSLYLTEAERQQLTQAWVAGDQAWTQQVQSLSPYKARQVRERFRWAKKQARQASQLKPVRLIDDWLQALDVFQQLRKTAATPEIADESVRLLQAMRRHAAKSSQDLGAWLQELEQARQEGTAHLGDSVSRISIQTVHSAKGLEWDWVAVYGLNEGDFPYVGQSQRLTSAALEAERRLAYVAMTRAKTQLLLVEEPASGMTSRFVTEAGLPLAMQLQDSILAGKAPKSGSLPALLDEYWHRVT